MEIAKERLWVRLAVLDQMSAKNDKQDAGKASGLKGLRYKGAS
jgi:hypothetical protein